MSERRGGSAFDLRDVPPEPADHLLAWERLQAAYRRRRARRQKFAVSGAAAAAALVVGGVAWLGGGTSQRPGVGDARVANGPLVFAQVRPGPATSLVNTDIVVANPDGSDVRALTADAGADEYAAITPNGTTIAYVEETATRGDAGSSSVHAVVRLMSVDGSGNRLAYSCRSTCSDLSWAPDGDRLAFADDGIRVLEPDGSVRLVCGSSCSDALAEPVWSPDGSQLAFSQRGVLGQVGVSLPPSAIFVVHSDGTGLQKLTDGACDGTQPVGCTLDTGPAWSPDGSLISFSRVTLPPAQTGAETAPDGPRGVFVMAPDGSGVREIWSCPHRYCQALTPHWSPDGARLAFAGDPVQRSAYIVDVTSRKTEVIPPPADGKGSGFAAVEWSPDGAALALTFARGADPGTLYTVNSDGTDLTRLAVPDVYATGSVLAWSPSPPSTTPSPIRPTEPPTAEPSGEVAYKCGNDLCLVRPDGTGQRPLMAAFPEWDPEWSPDGSRLAFRGYFTTAEGDYSIYVVDADGCHATRLRAADNGTQPTWAPTGDRLAYTLGGINAINVDGTGFRRLTRDTASWFDGSPSWSATNRIAFVRTQPGRSSRIFVMDGTGAHATPLLGDSQRAYEQPSWSPDGALLAVVVAGVDATPHSRPRQQIAVADADGHGLHAVTPAGWLSSSPTWTPDGRVAFLADTGSDTRAYVVNADGTDLHVLPLSLGDPNLDGQLAWGPSALPPPRCS